MKILLIAGARPNFMKIAPIIRELDKRNDSDVEYKIVHTSQHYDYEMSQAFFDDLLMSKPDGTLIKRLDVSKMDDLGWQAKVGLEKGIKDTYEWYVGNQF